MIQGTVKFVASVDHDGDCSFDVTISKGSLETHVHFYGDVDTWKDFGEKLIAFPQFASSRVVLDASHSGSRIDSLFLEAYCYDTHGHAASRVVVCNNEDKPWRWLLDFSIMTEAASFNHLGQALLNWQVENGSEIIWQARTS